ncbi:MAG: glcP1 [Chlamydiales bacterium]|jgi:FHS family glucose/mannose:H+ symporter-like MFS transporter|nr:glcP1 [Chlamydiales bacterium]
MKYFTFVSCLIYFLCGVVGTTLGSILPELLNYYDLSYTEGGQLVSLGSIGFLLGVPISSLLLGRFSEKEIIYTALLFVEFAQLCILSLPEFKYILFLNFINNIGIAALSTITATLLMEHFVGRRAVIMSYLEVAYGSGALVMPVLASVLISYNAWRYAFLITGFLAFLMLLVWRFARYSKNTPQTNTNDPEMPFTPQIMPTILKGQFIFLFVFMIFLYSGVEGSLNSFLSSIFISYLGVAANQASLSIAIFWVSMVIGRLATGWIIRKVTYGNFLFRSMVAALFIFANFIIWKNAVVGYILISFLGFAMSGVYSITMVYANHTFPGHARLITSLITGFAGLGSASFPALMGYTMDKEGVSSALLLVATLIVVYLVALRTVKHLYSKVAWLEDKGEMPS